MITTNLYTVLIDKYDIQAMKGGTDIGFPLKLNRHGALSLKGKAFDALHMFLSAYEFAQPKLKRLFQEIAESHAEEAALVDASNAAAETIAQKMMSNEPCDGEDMHTINRTKGAVINARESSAGNVFIDLNTMLQELKKDLEVTEQKFDSAAPKLHGASFGRIIGAASNNARHASEWRTQWVAHHAFTPQQLKSVQVLAPILGHTASDYRFLAGEKCAEVLTAICNNDFETFEKSLFDFVKNLADGVENIR